MKNIIKRIFLCVIIMTGIGLLTYPMVSDYVNRLHGSYAISELEQHVAQIEQGNLEKERRNAQEYNKRLPSDEMKDAYADILNISDGIMGSLQIPKISVNLPIYHGTSEEILEKGVGHLESSAFPVGGKGNHSVLTGHTGLPTAKLFTDLVQLKEGDHFYVHILDKTIAYCVNQIKVVLPDDGRDLAIVSDKDYCTLVTCTPYGVNSHRLLVRGERVDLPQQQTLEQLNQEVNRKWGLAGYLILTGVLFLCMGILFVLKVHRKKNS